MLNITTQCCITSTMLYIPRQSLLWQLRGVMSSLRIWRPRPQTQPFKRNFYSHQTFLTSQSSTSEKKFFSYKLYTKTQSRPPFSFHSRPVFPFKLGNGSFIRTLNFSPGHLWRWKIFLLFFSQSPSPQPTTIERLQFPFLIQGWEIKLKQNKSSDESTAAIWFQ